MAYIEIDFNTNNGNWEATCGGGMMAYDEDLNSVLKELTRLELDIENEDYTDHNEGSEFR